jgi:hypothetical protein
MALQYLIFNGPMQTTAAPASVTTSTSIKTLLQFKPLVPCKLIEWGISFDGSAAATPGKVELIDTGTVAATVTASVNADITKFNGDAAQFGDPTSTIISVGTTATGYTASAEGSTTAVRTFDLQLMAPTTEYVKQWPLGREPFLIASNLMRIRVTFAAAINAYCYIIAEF